ncbi:MAG: endonuclease/exonuclease/phosphatase family protein [Kiritimatiellae bacterium]|nr:endonuclease/exonuclease/phosphatase family protein [Kiritimatiellia bacterium]
MKRSSKLPHSLRGWKGVVTGIVLVLLSLFATDAKTGARTGTVNAVTAFLEDLISLFLTDDFGDQSAPPEWTDVDEDETADAAPQGRRDGPETDSSSSRDARNRPRPSEAQPSSAPEKVGRISKEMAASPTFYVASWNVENLFDCKDEPDKKDEEFLPTERRTRWTQERVDQKLSHLAQVIRYMNDGKGPDVLGLVEVETPELVEALLALLKGRDYAFVYGESPDYRGIDVAIVYDKRRFALKHERALRVRWPKTRVIQQATLVTRSGKSLHCFVNHWPSRGIGEEESDHQRRIMAQTLRKEIEKLQRKDASAAILAFGDFNDTPFDDSMATTLQAKAPVAKGARARELYNLSLPLAEAGQGTHASCSGWRKTWEWQMLDQLIASGGMLAPNAAIRYVPDSFEIVKPPFMFDQRGWRKGISIPTFQGTGRYRGGYSDHLPIGARFTIRN